jgi:ATP-binding cassette subfamily B multidrug efflux pump
MGHWGFMAEGKPRSVKGSLSRLLRYFSPYIGRLVVIFIIMLVAVLANIAGPYFTAIAVDKFIAPAANLGSPAQAALPGWLTLLVGISPSRAAGLAVTMVLLAITYALGWYLSVMMFRLMIRMSQKVLLLMRTQIFGQLQKLSLSYFDQHEAGDLMSRLVNDTQVINDVFGPGIVEILRSALTIVGVFISMMVLNWRLALVSFVVLPVFIVFTIFFSRRVRTAFRATRKTIGEVSANLQENISGVREVQAFAREGETLKEFQYTNLRNRDANVTAQTLSAAFGPILQGLTTIGIIITIGYGGYLVLGFTPPLVSIGVIVAFTNYVRRFYDPINQLLQLYNQFQSALAGAERIFELLDTPPWWLTHRMPGFCRRSRGISSTSTSPSATRKKSRCWRTFLSRSSPARRWPWWDLPVPAKRPSSTCSPACTTSSPVRCWWMAMMCATSQGTACAGRSAWCRRTHSSLPAR